MNFYQGKKKPWPQNLQEKTIYIYIYIYIYAPNLPFNINRLIVKMRFHLYINHP